MLQEIEKKIDEEIDYVCDKFSKNVNEWIESSGKTSGFVQKISEVYKHYINSYSRFTGYVDALYDFNKITIEEVGIKEKECVRKLTEIKEDFLNPLIR